MNTFTKTADSDTPARHRIRQIVNMIVYLAQKPVSTARVSKGYHRFLPARFSFPDSSSVTSSMVPSVLAYAVC